VAIGVMQRSSEMRREMRASGLVRAWKLAAAKCRFSSTIWRVGGAAAARWARSEARSSQRRGSALQIFWAVEHRNRCLGNGLFTCRLATIVLLPFRLHSSSSACRLAAPASESSDPESCEQRRESEWSAEPHRSARRPHRAARYRWVWSGSSCNMLQEGALQLAGRAWFPTQVAQGAGQAPPRSAAAHPCGHPLDRAGGF
jgi:hypothetical protein